MHRTFSVPCRIGWWSLLVCLTLHFGIHAAVAQNNLQPANYFPGRQDDPKRPVITMLVGTTQTFAMTTKADLKRVENPNSKVVRVGRIPDHDNEVLLVAEFPGRTLVTFTDKQDRVEVHEVVVTGEAVQDVKNVAKVRLERGEQRTYKLDKAALGGLRITRSEIVEVRQSQTDPKTFTFVARGSGTTRVFFFADKDQQDIVAIFDVEVLPEDTIGQLREIIKQFPTASVTATLIKLGTDIEKDGKKDAVLLTGMVALTDDAAAIVAAAKRLFPPSAIGMQSTAAGGVGTTQSLLRDNVINNIRIAGVQQVDLHVVVAVVNRTRARNMSFSFNASGPNFFASSIIGGPGTLTNLLTPLTPASTTASLTGTGNNLAFGVMGHNSSFLSFLNLLTTEGVVKILAEPRVTTLSGRPANILSGGTTPILTSSGIGAPSVTYQQFGTVVNCLPVVQGNGKILLDVKADLSNINVANGLTIGGVTPTSIPGFDQRTAQVTIMVEDGQTMVIGGLIQNKINATISKIPVLGDLPFLSVFFTSKSYSEEEEEMVILVTPRLVDPIDCTKFPKYLPGRETRSPDDFEFFLEGILEAPRGPRDVVLHPRLYQPAYKGAPNVGQIPCADGSCNGRPGAGCATGNCAPGLPGNVSIPRPLTTTTGTTANFVAPTTVTAPTIPNVPAIPTSNPNRILIEPEVPMLAPPIREIPSTLGPATPTIPSAPPREMQSRPVLPPLSTSPYTPN